MSPEAGAALIGLGAGLAGFVVLVWFPWFLLQRRARKKAEERLAGWVAGDPPATARAAGALLYDALGELATVDYEKHRDVRLHVARVLQRAAASPGYSDDQGSRNDG